MAVVGGKTRARDLVYRAVKSGALVRGPCEVCGDLKVQAHHDDYLDPLSVRWLCQKHHAEERAGIGGKPDMVVFRCSREQKAAWTAAANAAGLSVSGWIRGVVNAASVEGAGEGGLTEREEVISAVRGNTVTRRRPAQAAPARSVSSSSGTPGTCAKTGLDRLTCLCPNCKSGR